MKKVFFLFIILIFLSSCDDMDSIVQDMMVVAKLTKEAEIKAVFPPCPKDKPYRIGMPITGPCVDEETLGEYFEIKLTGNGRLPMWKKHSFMCNAYVLNL